MPVEIFSLRWTGERGRSIATHRRYLQEGHDLAWLAAELTQLRERIRELLEQGARGRHERTRNFCTGLLEEYEALWTFCEAPGIDPTNYAELPEPISAPAAVFQANIGITGTSA